MSEDIAEVMKTLHKMKRAALYAHYQKLIGTVPPCSDRRYLAARIGWQFQVDASRDLSERARERATELAAGFDLRLRPSRPERVGTASRRNPSHDARLPAVGTVLTRYYKGNPVMVQVLEQGFEHDGRLYTSLSAVALRATGTRWNGFLFFALNGAERHA